MAQEQADLKAHIEEETDNLKDNLEEFEDRVKNVLDWKVWYRHNTALAIGGAAAGGALLALLLPKGPSVEDEFIQVDEMDELGVPLRSQESRARSRSAHGLHKVLDNTAAAVLGVAGDLVQNFMARALPGFKEHYDRAERRHT